MSEQTVRAFWQKANADRALQARLAAFQGQDRQATVAAVMQIAAAAGFPFTAAEYEAALKEELTRRHAAGALHEEQLEALAGGSGTGSILGSIGGSSSIGG
jgi:predicted ribosomally synthesized peptide with nif11-like leader